MPLGGQVEENGRTIQGLNTTKPLSRELAWEVTSPRNSIYLLSAELISCPCEEPVKLNHGLTELSRTLADWRGRCPWSSTVQVHNAAVMFLV